MPKGIPRTGTTLTCRREHVSWFHMLSRCTDRKNRQFADYGGRGITVCDRWRLFANFLADMGPKPTPKHSVERRENDKGYSPDNCYWATPSQQQRNKRNSVMLTHNGITLCLADWADRVGIPAKLLSQRLKTYRWTLERSLTAPVLPPGKHRRRSNDL